MSATRKPTAYHVRFKVLSRHAFAVECPRCGKWQGVGLMPYFSQGFRLNKECDLWPHFVCMAETHGQMCDFSGPIRLAIREDA